VPAASAEHRESSAARAPQPAIASAQGTSATPEAQSAAGLFRLASVARRAGRLREAADDYAALLERHPADARAGLSAFELGRIRMDALGEPLAAIEALERAAATGARTSFHEDALARIVVANDALGRREACRRARERYLAGYPNGVHARALLAQCR
jgi:tetratricopeptide (TPR) repeat protein